MSDEDESSAVLADSTEVANLPYTLPYALLCGCTWGLPFASFIVFLLLSYSFLDEKKLFTLEQSSTAHHRLITVEESPCKAIPYLLPCTNDTATLQFQVYYDKETVECLNVRQLPVGCLPWAELFDPKPPKSMYDCVSQCEVSPSPQQMLEYDEMFPDAGLGAAASQTDLRDANIGGGMEPALGQQLYQPLVQPPPAQPGPPPAPVGPGPVPAPAVPPPVPPGPVPPPVVPPPVPPGPVLPPAVPPVKPPGVPKQGCHHGFELRACTVADIMSSYYDATLKKCFQTQPNGTTCYGAPMPLQSLEFCDKNCPTSPECHQSPIIRKCTVKDKARSAFYNPFTHVCQDLEIGNLCLGGDNRFANFSECENACLRRSDDDVTNRRSGQGVESPG